ncbi:MAG: FemAB family XrtA/PEP-CTERM system-associated protein [Planctomycetaceae bacterium]
MADRHPPLSVSDPVVRVVECRDRDAWDRYALENAGLFHRWDWDDVFRVYRLPVRRLAAWRDERIVGVLPLVQQRSRLFGNHLVSLPWFDAAGVAADDVAAAEALIEAAQSFRVSIRGETIQLRQDHEAGISPYCRNDKVLMRLRLPGDAEQLWDGLKPKVRNQARKAEKAGLAVNSGGVELLPEFFDVYSRNMRDLGSPSHSLRFFRAICEAFAAEVRLWTVSLSGNTIGAGFTMNNGSVLEIPWASSLREHGSLCVNHLMYWRILEFACRAGFEWFHFGRSTVDSGPYRFKKQWGAEAVPLSWYFLGAEHAAAEAAHDPGERFGLAQQVWSRLPLCVSRRLGPFLISKLA